MNGSLGSRERTKGTGSHYPWPAIVVLVITLLVTASLVGFLDRTVREKDHLTFEREADRIAVSVEEAFRSYTTLIRSVAALFASQNTVTLNEFRSFASRFRLDSRYPGILGIGFSRRVPAGEIDRFAENLSEEYGRTITIYPDDPRAEYHAIEFLEPQNRRNEVAVGYDMYTNPIRRDAMERARDHGRAAISGRVTLVQEIDPDKQAGFLIYLPVYSTGSEFPPSIEQRRDMLVGFAYAPFRAGDVFGTLLGRQMPRDVAVSIYAGSTARPDALLYRSSLLEETSFSSERRVRLADSEWLLVIESSAAYGRATERQWIPIVAIIGTLLALLLFSLTRSLVATRAQERKATEDLVIQSNLLETITENVTTALFLMDEKGHPTFLNQAAKEVTGYDSIDEIRDRPLHYAVHYKKPDGSFYPMEECPIDNASAELTHLRDQEEIFVRKDGTLFPVVYSVAPLESEGRTLGAVIEVRDMTEKKATERAAREAAERFQFLAESVPQKIFTARPDGGVDYLNRQWLEYTGSTIDDLKDWRWTKLVHPDDLDENLRRWTSAVERGSDYEVEHRFRRADGVYRWHLTRARAMRDDDGTIRTWIGSTTDIEDQKQTERTLQRLFEEAESANRAKDEFLATVSHELRTPMTSILGWSRLLMAEESTDPLVAEAAESISRSAVAQAQLIDDLLDVSRIATGKIHLRLATASLEPVLREAIDAVKSAAEARQITITSRIDDDLPPILFDRARLQQVFWNLLSNGVKFTAAGGHVELVATSDDESVIVKVTDTGKGIRKDFLPYVFDRFRQEETTTTRQFSGLGLGLAIVRQLVELHGGTVTAASEGEGKGAEFTVTIPLQPVVVPGGDGDPSSGSSIDPERTSSSARLDGLRLLVVDDEPSALRVVAATLERAGAIVRTASSAADAFAMLDGAIEVLVSDIAMPEEDGYSLLRRVRTDMRFRNLPAIALTAFGREIDREKVREAGFDAHLVKPVDPAVLVDTVRSVSASRRAES